MLKKKQTLFGLVFVFALLFQFITVGALQSAEVKVYAFKCGILKTQTQFILKDTRVGTPFDIPVPFFIIKHGKDWVAFDTGNNAKVAVDPTGYWGEGIVKAYTPVMKPEEAFTQQIKKLGLTPKDFKAVIISHGHLDHAGSIDSFKGTQVPIYFQKAELAEIKKLLEAKKEGTAYILADFDLMKDLNIKEVEGIFDLFGDKTVVSFPTPGHTQGHQSLYVKPSKGTPFIYAADVMY
ncbi:MAG TPA: N-acyl homoserine lactonase family protein, partial [Thermodesulfobacteriota bacterium]|nr:N-acyl homoserine lactonase family protein [Thermodesulfobacteriota bacterium]